jgi:hypothetical protein
MDTRQDQAFGASTTARGASNKPSSVDMDQVLLDYLMVEGFQDAAQCFATEARLEASNDLSAVAKRMTIRKTLEAGDVAKAFDLVNDLNPAVFDGNPALYFQLRLQQLVELIRADKVAEALAFAQVGSKRYVCVLWLVST